MLHCVVFSQKLQNVVHFYKSKIVIRDRALLTGNFIPPPQKKKKICTSEKFKRFYLICESRLTSVGQIIFDSYKFQMLNTFWETF